MQCSAVARLCVWALEQKALFQSSSSFSLCVASLVSSPGVITAKIRLSIRSYYHKACGPRKWIHSLTHTCDAPRRPGSRCGRQVPSVKWESKLCSRFLKFCSCFLFGEEFILCNENSFKPLKQKLYILFIWLKYFLCRQNHHLVSDLNCDQNKATCFRYRTSSEGHTTNY